MQTPQKTPFFSTHRLSKILAFFCCARSASSIEGLLLASPVSGGMAQFSKRLSWLFLLLCAQLFFADSASATSCAPTFSTTVNTAHTYTLQTNVGGADYSCDNNGTFGIYNDTVCDTGPNTTSQGGTAYMDGGSPDTIQYTPPNNFVGTDILTFYTTTNGATCVARTATVTVTGLSVNGVAPGSGPITSGNSVVITGTGFSGATSVTFGGTNATSYTVNSSTQITAVAPAHSAGTVDIIVVSPPYTSAAGASDHYVFVAAPTVTSLATTSGPTGGTTSVVITGTNFTGATAVNFGGTAASSFTVNSAMQITATAPAHAAGTIDITVVTTGGTSATGAGDHFTYVSAPTVTSLVTTSGPTGGATSVIITGTNFSGATGVNFGGTAGTSVVVNSTTQITVNSPAHTAGTIDVTVITPGGTSATGAGDHFAYVAAPTVTSLATSSGPVGGGTSVVITGTNFTGATAANFGVPAGTSLVVNSATQITVTSPINSAGIIDITVVTPGGTSATSGSDQFTYVVAPAVTSLSPTSGASAGGTSVVITGTNFTGASAVKFGVTNASSYTVNSATQITATAPAGSGTVDVTVITMGGTSSTSGSDPFTYVVAPAVTSLSPTSGASAGGTSVVITGTNFTGASAVKFGVTNASSYTVNSATQITATAPAGSGTVDVRVVTVGGTSSTSANDLFIYVPVGVITFTTPIAVSVMMGNTLTNAATSTLSGGSYGAITYSSSNTAVATVSASGVVTSVSAGTATITAMQAAVNGMNAQATQTYSLTVNALPVGTLRFTTPTSATITMGNTLTNAATSTLSGGSYGASSYSSSNTAVETVSASGVVTSVSAGTATITATQAAVNGVNAQATQSYTLTVGKQVQIALKLTATKTSIFKGSGTSVLSTTGGSGTGALTYSVTGGCTINGNTLTASNIPGNCIVTATKAADANFAVVSANLTIIIQNTYASTVSLNASNHLPMQGQSLTLSVAITPTIATGNVTIVDGTTTIDNASVQNGVLTYTTSSLSVGIHSFVANYAGDAQTSPGSSVAVIVSVNSRPDPSTNTVVKAHINSQVTNSQRFTLAQINNIYNHVELLHNDFTVHNSFGIGLNAPNMDVFNMVTGKLYGNFSSAPENTINDLGIATASNQLGSKAHGPFVTENVNSDDQISKENGADTVAQSPGQNGMQLAGKPVAFWTAGNIDVGHMGNADGGNTKFSSTGVTIGVDMLWSPKLIVGASAGYAKDSSTFDTMGSDSDSKQVSASLYGSYKVNKEWFIDGVLGYGHMTFDNHRWDDIDSVLLNGNRSGSVEYAVLSIARNMLIGDINFQPFGRFDLVHANLNAYSEQGSMLAVTYTDASLNNTSFTGGLNVFKNYYKDAGIWTPSLKLQVRHRTSGEVSQNMYYSDLGSGSTLYNVSVTGLPDNTESLGLGMSYKTRRGLLLNFNWLGSMGSNNYHANSFKIDARAGF